MPDLAKGDDFRGVIGRGAKNPHRVIMRQHHMLDRLVGHGADFLDHHVGEPRRCLRVDHHDAVIADDHAGVRVAFCGEGPQVTANLGPEKTSISIKLIKVPRRQIFYELEMISSMIAQAIQRRSLIIDPQ